MEEAEEAEEDEEVEEKEKAPPANQVESLDPFSPSLIFYNGPCLLKSRPNQNKSLFAI